MDFYGTGINTFLIGKIVLIIMIEEKETEEKKKVTAIMKKTIGTKLITYTKRLKLKI